MPATSLNPQPVVLSINCNDPCGGGGIAADIETIASLGGHCAPVISNILVRDTEKHRDQQAIDTGLLIAQMRVIMEDLAISAIKIGDLGSTRNVEAIHSILNDYPNIPVVLEPVADIDQDGDSHVNAIRSLLLPQATVTLISQTALRRLSPNGDNPTACAREAMDDGCRALLITNIPAKNNEVESMLFSHQGQERRFHYPRAPTLCHGATATFSAGIAICLAHGFSLGESVQKAQDFTWKSIQYAARIGNGRPIPDRLHWCRGADSEA
jgi:hydroxymethylpyrimidine/phosphomethylpyrimidine kinase